MFEKNQASLQKSFTKTRG